VTSLADIVRQYGSSYIRKYGSRLLPSHKRALRDILLCRTPDLGGQTWFCSDCNEYHYAYHSCRNRHCPKCENDKATDWLNTQKDLLLPVQYFMATVTVPEGLRSVIRQNQKTLYSLLFKASAQAIQDLALDRRFIGGKTGLMAVLQTWTRNLVYHPHIHFLIPGCALDDTGKIRRAKQDFFVHVKPLSILIRAKFKESCKELALYDLIPQAVWHQNWIVHIEPVGTGEAALKYLAPYIFRVAISDRNILSSNNGMVTFQFKDSETRQYNTCTLEALKFLSLFLQHVLPRKFVKVRYYGFLASKNRAVLELVKKQVGILLAPIKRTIQKALKPFKCPQCGKPMLFICELPGKRGPPVMLFSNKPAFSKSI
jgi:hypothetical protein